MASKKEFEMLFALNARMNGGFSKIGRAHV